MSDKALTRAELELTQKMQRHFPWGTDPNIVRELNECPKEIFEARLAYFIQNRGQLRVIATNGVMAPKDGIVQVLTVPVNESRIWDEAIRAAGPDTPKDDHVWKVGNQYLLLAGAVERLEEIYIVNFGNARVTLSNATLVWGKSQHLIPASPRACFAIGECYPKLNTYLKMDLMGVVSFKECSFEGGRLCCLVWFRGSDVRKAGLRWFEGDWGCRYWFAFVRDSAPSTLGF